MQTLQQRETMVDYELDELKREFLAEAEEKVRDIQAALDAPRSDESLERLAYLAHQLKGSGGSYGYQTISSEAAELEQAVESLTGGAASGDGLDAKLQQHITNLAQEITARATELGPA
jgi:HPt (histidine-containing phosphotransfer) domain-containing protein